ncbi:MAG: hypothetical protein E6590_16705 [Clostridiales bacterium]|nr:hypothetical protein [Clostridiales bacterium]
MEDSKKFHSITLQYLSQFDYSDKTPEEYANIYLETISKISNTIKEHDAKIQNEILKSYSDLL